MDIDKLIKESIKKNNEMLQEEMGKFVTKLRTSNSNENKYERAYKIVCRAYIGRITKEKLDNLVRLGRITEEEGNFLLGLKGGK